MTIIDAPWWKDAVVYQIYPASFKDTNGDGLGDLQGIISELDYIKTIGANVIWVCPMYESPQVDMGYDISNYESVHAPYGTMKDMEHLISEAHQRGIRVILDLVINHTSNLHAWFKESRSSKNNPKRDWYIWRPAKHNAQGKRMPPNNWRSNFGGSAWEWDEATQEYYLHLFCPEQPDLNWENDETRAAIYQSAIIFWLEKGVDGFRVDTVNMYSKSPAFPDAEIIDPTTEWQLASHLFCNGPKMRDYLLEMNEIFQRYGAMTVGELPCTPDMAKVIEYVSARQKQLNMVFQFDVVDVGMGKDQKFNTFPRNWDLSQLKKAVLRTQDVIRGTDAWTTTFLENHDQARSISRFGADNTPELRNISGKMLSILTSTLSGTLFIYQGQEIGMVNAPESWPISEYKDVDSNNYMKYIVDKSNGDPKAIEDAMKALQYLARDHARMPVQWNETKNGGFTSSDHPWMKVNDNFAEINVKKESADPDSILSFWKRMLQLRKQHSDLFTYGEFNILDIENPDLFIYEKKANSGRKAIIALNFKNGNVEFDSALIDPSSKLITSNYANYKSSVLRPFEARVYLTS